MINEGSNENYNAWAFADDHYLALKTTLIKAVEEKLEHGDVEMLIGDHGNEIMRQLLQAYLDLLARNETRYESISGPNAQALRHVRTRERTLGTVFGDVSVQRLGYSAPEVPSVFPLDQILNLPPDKYSQGLRCKVAQEAVKGCFDQVVAAIDRDTGGKVPKRQVEQIVQAVGVDFEAFYLEQAAKTSEGLLIMSVDGKGVVVRKQDLREGTRKASEKSAQKLKTRLSRGEKPNRKRMATVATVYDIAPHVRTKEQIMGQCDDSSERPKPLNKRVWASLERSPLEVIDAVLKEAQKRDPEHQRTWLMLVDGLESQLKQVYQVIANYQAKVVVIQDFVHVMEYLWKAAYCFHAEGSEAVEAWVMARALNLLDGKASQVAAGMRRSATRRKLSKQERSAVDKCARYLLKNKRRLDYAQALSEGWPIATGVIEGACRHLVKDRMDITGARWSLEGAEAILRLRSLYASGDIHDYLNYHRKQERVRNYGQNAANSELFERVA